MKTRNPIRFGTDGWRAVIAQDFTFDNVRICAQGLVDYMKQSGLAERGLVIGYDTRFASEDFAAAAAEVAAANEIKVYLSHQGFTYTCNQLCYCRKTCRSCYYYYCQP